MQSSDAPTPELEGRVSTIRERLAKVEEAIAASARKVGRDPGEVRIVAVTKGHGPETVRAALAAGLSDLGENRVEELEEKVALLPDAKCRWHMVGRLQRRKAPRAVEAADFIHSVDSVRLAERLQRVLPGVGVEPFPILLQVNTSGEEAKTGFTDGEVLDALGRILELSSLRVEGLMTMAPWVAEQGVIRRTFRRLRELHEEARSVPGYQGRELSMGMSNDYEIAVEEGGTMIRLGTALLGERPG